jgi:PAS domain-containing protein
LQALERASDAERLRLALTGAGEAAFDWTLGDDHMHWDGAELLLRCHPDPERLQSGEVFCQWLNPSARGRLLSLIEERSPADPNFVLEFEVTTPDRREWFELRAVRVPDGTGRSERVAGVLRSISDH